jgi:hypothetical protein
VAAEAPADAVAADGAQPSSPDVTGADSASGEPAAEPA